MKNCNFVHLHLHDEYSALDGFGSPETYARRAATTGFKYLAVTNHGNVDSAIKFQKACLDNGISPLIGCELYIDKDRTLRGKEAKRRHIVVLVKNDKGWANLLKMLTMANLEGFCRRPRIDPAVLLRHCKGLVVTTACCSSFINEDWGVKLLRQLKRKIPGDVYVEIMPHDYKEQASFNRLAIKLAEKYGLPVISTNDCHYPRIEDSISQEVQLAIGSSAKWSDKKRFRFSVETLHLCSANELMKYYRKNHDYISADFVKETMANTLEVAEKCSGFVILPQKVSLPLIPQCKEGKEDRFFIRLIKKGLKKKIRDGLIPESDVFQYDSRIKEELSILVSKGFSRYFLIVWELMEWCKENCIFTGPGRGSVGGCLVAYLIGITEVDPLKYDLVFSRFISPDRNDLPDIDLDFEKNRRGDVIDHLKLLYGKDNVSQISTYLTMKGKGVLQDVSRVFGIHSSEVSKITKHIDSGEELDLQFFQSSPEESLRSFARKYEEAICHSVNLQGTVRGYGKHAAGVCISNENLSLGSKCNLVKRSGSIVANWDKDDSEFMGLMKLDVLGLVALDRLHECVKLIFANHGRKIDLRKLSLDDAAVFSDLNNGETTGVFQLGSPGLTRFCKELGISSFKDIYNATALFRPGTLRSGMAAQFVKRKAGKKWKAIHFSVKDLTKDTYGIILYQEQVMSMANELAGFSWAKCNQLRKVIAKSKGAEEFEKFKDDFIAGCEDTGHLNRNQAKALFRDIVSFSSYAFNKSHSVEYSVLSYWDAWLKHYFPSEFFASSLTFTNKDKRKELLSKAIESGLTITLPKIGVSTSEHWQVNGSSLVMPFIEINGVGENMAKKIVSESTKKRRGFFSSSSSLALGVREKEILKDIGAYSNSPLKYSDIKKANKYFQYNLLKLMS